MEGIKWAEIKKGGKREKIGEDTCKGEKDEKQGKNRRGKGKETEMGSKEEER